LGERFLFRNIDQRFALFASLEGRERGDIAHLYFLGEKVVFWRRDRTHEYGLSSSRAEFHGSAGNLSTWIILA
jgi:hypothetical protein